MSDNIRTALYGADVHLRARLAASRRRRRCSPAWSESTARAGDIVVTDAFLPADVAPGDLLAVAGHRRVLPRHGQQLQPRAAAAGGRGRDGAAAVIVRRETEDDLLALDVGMTDGGRAT